MWQNLHSQPIPYYLYNNAYGNFGDRDIKEIHKFIANVNNRDKNKTITKLNEIMKSKLEQALQGKRVQPKYADKDEKVSIQCFKYEAAIVKLRDIRERELKLRKAEEHLKNERKIFKDEQSKIVLLESRCQYLESKNCELESLVNTMKRRLDMNTSTNINNPQGMEHSTPLNDQMQGKINNRILAF
ncbi:unnamed protein product [Mytilus edulis]|uniref:Uncharacterized protein n=1 Tax=Mytilus edulis TaxID=6550 RepID=A0A8S3V322_MYTED|nr:unnamed protein product [Mytilus edulis]